MWGSGEPLSSSLATVDFSKLAEDILLQVRQGGQERSIDEAAVAAVVKASLFQLGSHKDVQKLLGFNVSPQRGMHVDLQSAGGAQQELKSKRDWLVQRRQTVRRHRRW